VNLLKKNNKSGRKALTMIISLCFNNCSND